MASHTRLCVPFTQSTESSACMAAGHNTQATEPVFLRAFAPVHKTPLARKRTDDDVSGKIADALLRATCMPRKEVPSRAMFLQCMCQEKTSPHAPCAHHQEQVKQRGRHGSSCKTMHMCAMCLKPFRDRHGLDLRLFCAAYSIEFALSQEWVLLCVLSRVMSPMTAESGRHGS